MNEGPKKQISRIIAKMFKSDMVIYCKAHRCVVTLNQQMKFGNKGIVAGKVIIIAGLCLLGYTLYSVISAQLGFDSCPQFGRGDSIVIISWCGDPSQYWPYVFGSLISLVLGFFVFLSALTRFSSPYETTRNRISIEIMLTTFAVVFLGVSILLILSNFHVDYYG